MIVSEPSWTPEPGPEAVLEENWLFRLRKERFRSRLSGRLHDYFVIHLADAVSVIALTKNRDLILVRQFRAGSGRDSLETPGGLLEPGEDPLDAGPRELLEETGFAGDPPTILGTVWSNPSLMTSRTTTIVIANVQQVTSPKLDEGEEVEVVREPARRVPDLLRNGEINHALVVSGLLWWMASELPDSPLETWPGTGSIWYQFRIRTLIALVTGSALIFGFVANFGTYPLIGLAVIFVHGLADWIVRLKFDPPDPSPLSFGPATARRRALRGLASIGLSVLLLAALVLLLAILPR